jgi:hypothetical protein
VRTVLYNTSAKPLNENAPPEGGSVAKRIIIYLEHPLQSRVLHITRNHSRRLLSDLRSASPGDAAHVDLPHVAGTFVLCDVASTLYEEIAVQEVIAGDADLQADGLLKHERGAKCPVAARG